MYSHDSDVAASPVKIAIGKNTRIWAPYQDIILPIDGMQIKGFKNWLNWFGYNEDYNHLAFDFAAYLNNELKCVFGLPGGTEVKAVAGGLVKEAVRFGYAGWIIIEHGVQNSGMFSEYWHVIPLVKEGQNVEKGEVIAKLYKDKGCEAGRLVHLHLMLSDQRTDNKYYVDPIEIFPHLDLYQCEPQPSLGFKIKGLDVSPEIVRANFRRLIFGFPERKLSSIRVSSPVEEKNRTVPDFFLKEQFNRLRRFGLFQNFTDAQKEAFEGWSSKVAETLLAHEDIQQQQDIINRFRMGRMGSYFGCIEGKDIAVFIRSFLFSFTLVFLSAKALSAGFIVSGSISLAISGVIARFFMNKSLVKKAKHGDFTPGIKYEKNDGIIGTTYRYTVLLPSDITDRSQTSFSTGHEVSHIILRELDGNINSLASKDYLASLVDGLIRMREVKREMLNDPPGYIEELLYRPPYWKDIILNIMRDIKKRIKDLPLHKEFPNIEEDFLRESIKKNPIQIRRKIKLFLFWGLYIPAEIIPAELDCSYDYGLRLAGLVHAMVRYLMAKDIPMELACKYADITTYLRVFYPTFDINPEAEKVTIREGAIRIIHNMALLLVLRNPKTREEAEEVLKEFDLPAKIKRGLYNLILNGGFFYKSCMEIPMSKGDREASSPLTLNFEPITASSPLRGSNRAGKIPEQYLPAQEGLVLLRQRILSKAREIIDRKEVRPVVVVVDGRPGVGKMRIANALEHIVIGSGNPKKNYVFPDITSDNVNYILSLCNKPAAFERKFSGAGMVVLEDWGSLSCVLLPIIDVVGIVAADEATRKARLLSQKVHLYRDFLEASKGFEEMAVRSYPGAIFIDNSYEHALSFEELKVLFSGRKINPSSSPVNRLSEFAIDKEERIKNRTVPDSIDSLRQRAYDGVRYIPPKTRLSRN
ncbi:MAG: M23 family metallopeptidase, partial [Candidatus Omnitrophota bacterium]